ncbi:MAG: aminotransferase class V-fold PLP-dependent enzyme, partial [bacterium]|nr:aminotransferase class V-fold PLP-dependent enzyme [bacterium]
RVLVDGAQAVPHYPIDVQDLGCDFLAFSSHKMCGPTGVGVLYGKKELLDVMPPLLFGGDMVETVEQYTALYREAPWKFEAGTPNIADVVAFSESIAFLESIGMSRVQEHGQDILTYAKERFSRYPVVTLYTPSQSEAGAILSFTIEGIHPHDIASLFDSEGVAIRSGMHCAEPLMHRLNVPATARMSFYVYTTREDIDRAETALKKTLSTFKL